MRRVATTNRQTENSSERQVIERDTEHERLDVSTITEQASDEEVITVEREYDTTLPTDPTTGTPPLKRETTQTRRKADAGRQEQTVGQTADRQRDVAGQDATQSRDVVAVETDEKRGLNTLQEVLLYIGAFAVLLGAVWLASKFNPL